LKPAAFFRAFFLNDAFDEPFDLGFDFARGLGDAVIFPFLLVVFLVGQNVNNVDPLFIVSDFGNEPVLVSADIEDRAITNGIGVWKIGTSSSKIHPASVLRYPIPNFERLFGVGVRFSKNSRRAFLLMIRIVSTQSGCHQCLRGPGHFRCDVATLNLSCRRAGDRLYEVNHLGTLEFRERRTAMCQQIGFGSRTAQHYRSRHFLAIGFVRYSEAYCLGDRRVGQQHFVDLARGDLLSAAIDQLLDSANQRQIAL
jgi:hypothetical protein